MKHRLHVVALTIPYPPNYGGAIDIYYKLKKLVKHNVEVILHCFKYDRETSIELEELCTEVKYYKRSKGINNQFSFKPFIAITRFNQDLYNNLNKDDYPILIEGLHSCELINHVNPSRIFVRTHNIEHTYYNELSKSSNNIFKKTFYKLESYKLKHYEPILKNASGLFCISKFELPHFKDINLNSFFLPPFHKYEVCESRSGQGEYILIHGNLSVEENIKSTLFFIKNIIPNINFKFIIAGKNPDSNIKSAVDKLSNTELVENPTEDSMEKLINHAQIIVLHTYQATGIKLKLIHSLFAGRHIICNDAILVGTGLEDSCYVANTQHEWIKHIENLKNISFSNENISQRKSQLKLNYDNEINIDILINNIFY
nr:glycosyltransferase [uncultured Carboxylicivirga sp.]